jgi:hypothetical protein
MMGETKETGPITVPYPNSEHRRLAIDATEVIGFVAQEAEVVLPAMVKQIVGFIDGEEVPDLRVLQTTPVTYALVNAVKELSTKLDAALARIAALEA